MLPTREPIEKGHGPRPPSSPSLTRVAEGFRKACECRRSLATFLAQQGFQAADQTAAWRADVTRWIRADELAPR
jgi:hypothetical protein